MFRKAQDLGLGLEVQDEFSEKIKESNQHPQSQGTGLNIQKQPASSISRYRFKHTGANMYISGKQFPPFKSQVCF